MLPLRDVIPTRTTPWIAIVIVGAYVLAAGGGVLPHTGWLSIVANVLPFLIFGETLEDRLGHPRFLVFVAVGAVVAVAAGAWVAADAPAALVVVTGAAATVIGGYFALFRRSRVLLFLFVDAVELPALLILAFWVVLHAVSMDPIESQYLARPILAAQVGGMMTGAATVWALRRRERMRPEWWNRIR